MRTTLSDANSVVKGWSSGTGIFGKFFKQSCAKNSQVWDPQNDGLSKGLLPFLTNPVTYIWLWTPRDRNLPYSCLDAADTCPDTQHSVWQSRHLINVRISFHSQPPWTQAHLLLLPTWPYFLHRPIIGYSFCLSLCIQSLPSWEEIFFFFPYEHRIAYLRTSFPSLLWNNILGSKSSEDMRWDSLLIDALGRLKAVE